MVRRFDPVAMASGVDGHLLSIIDTLHRGLADNSVSRVIEQVLRADLIIIDEIGFAPIDATLLPEHTTAVSLLDRLLHHSVLVATKASRSA